MKVVIDGVEYIPRAEVPELTDERLKQCESLCFLGGIQRKRIEVTERKLICIDLETTGVDPETDRIIEIAMLEVTDKPHASKLHYLINPGVPIPKVVEDLTGITNERVENAPKFHSIADMVWSMLQGVDLLGFNIRSFDLPLLVNELQRCNYYWDLSDVRILDAMVLFKKQFPRTLDAAIKNYLPEVVRENAHSAMPDVEYTIEVWKEQLRRGGLESKSRDELERESTYMIDGMYPIDLAGKIGLAPCGTICWTFGKNKGKAVKEDRGYCTWVLNSDFPLDTKRHLRRILDAE